MSNAPGGVPQGAPQGGQPTGPAPDSPEYIQQMMGNSENPVVTDDHADFVGQTPDINSLPLQQGQDDGQQQQVPAMPEGGLEKYYNPTTGEYNIAAHIKEMNFNATRQQQQQQQAAEPVTNEDGTPAVPASMTAFEGVQEEINTLGTLSEATIERLSQHVPKEYVNSFVEMREALAEVSQELALMDMPGGTPQEKQAAMKGLLQWAAKNMTPQEIQAYDAMLADPRQVRKALNILSTRRGQADPQLHHGGSAPNASLVGFNTMDEQSEAIGDPKYGKDRAYTEQVQRRIMVSTYPGDQHRASLGL